LREAQTPGAKSGRDAGFCPRKGLKRKYFCAVPGKKDWSGKPGFRYEVPEMRPKEEIYLSMNFVAIDFETAKYSPESACSVGLAKYRDGSLTDSFYSLIRPPVLYIRPDFTEIHGLTVEDVRDAPGFADIWSRLLPFIDGLPLAAHNASFDMGVLGAVLRWYDLPAPRLKYFCTLRLSRKAWPELKSHALTRLGETFGIVYNAHNALDDAKTCGAIACLAAEKYGAGTLRALLAASGTGMKRLA
jgi:DNA polymerase-3 subunit epsilon